MERKKLRKLITGVLISTMVLSGCGGSASKNTDTAGTPVAQTSNTESTEITPVDTSDIVVAIDTDLGDISPFGLSGAGRNYIRFMLYDCIAQSSEAGQSLDQMDFALAKSYEKISDSLYQFTLYDYITDTAGNHMTADDVVFSLNKAVELGTSTKFTANLDYVKVIDEYTFEIGLKSPKLGIIEYMVSQIPIVTQAAYESQSENELATEPITTGPYYVSDFVSGSRIVLTKNEDYWQTDESLRCYQAKQNADQVTLQVTTETSQRAIALETSNALVSSNIAVSDIGEFMNEDGSSKDEYNVKPVLSGTTTVIEFNCEKGYTFDNLALRQACLYAIDNAAVMQASIDGKGLIAKDFSSQGVSDYNPEWNNEDYYDYDLEKAKELLTQSDYSADRITIMGNADTKTACEIIQSYLLQLNIKSDIQIYDSALFNTNMYDPNQWDILVNTYGFTNYTADGWLLRLDRTGFSNNKTGGFVNDDTLQKLVEDACNIQTHSQETVDAVHEYLKEKAYVYGLYTPYKYVVARNSVNKIVTHPWGQIIAGACEYAK